MHLVGQDLQKLGHFIYSYLLARRFVTLLQHCHLSPYYGLLGVTWLSCKGHTYCDLIFNDYTFHLAMRSWLYSLTFMMMSSVGQAQVLSSSETQIEFSTSATMMLAALQRSKSRYIQLCCFSSSYLITMNIVYSTFKTIFGCFDP